MAESLPVTEHTTAEKAAPTEMSEVRPAEVPEAPVKMPEGLNLEIRDGQGRWELGVVRENQTVHLEFHGDPELRRIVQESTREVGERMARHGDTLGSVSWRPIASSSSSSSEQQLGDNQHQQNTPQQNGQQSTQQHKNGDSPSETPQKSSSSSPKTNRRALRVI
jgi:hypothetical protein